MHGRLRSGTLPRDYVPMAAILNAARPRPTTPEELAESQSWWPAGSISQLIVAEDEAGRAIGFAQAYRFPNTAPGNSTPA